MIHEILLVLSGFESSIVKAATNNDLGLSSIHRFSENSDTFHHRGIHLDENSIDLLQNQETISNKTLLHPAEKKLLETVAEFGARHHQLIETVRTFEYTPAHVSGLPTSFSFLSHSDNTYDGDNNATAATTAILPPSYVIVRPAIVTTFRTHVLLPLATQLQSIESLILRKDARYVGGNNTVSVAQVVSEVVLRWNRVIRYSLYVLALLRVQVTPANINTEFLPGEFGLPMLDKEISQTSNAFGLFTGPIGYPEVDLVREKCLLAAHRVWLQMAVSWLLYGHVAATSSLIYTKQRFGDNLTDDTEVRENHRAIVEYLLANPSQQPITATAGLGGKDSLRWRDAAGDASQWENGAPKDLFLPPKVSYEMGYLIYTTGNMVYQFLGANGAFSVDDTYSLNIPNFLSKSPSISSFNSFLGVSSLRNESSELLHSATTTVAELTVPINVSELRFAVRSLRSAILRTLGGNSSSETGGKRAGPFRASRVCQYFWTLRKVALAGDAEFCAQLGIQSEDVKKEAEMRSSGGGMSSFSLEVYDDDENDDDDMEGSNENGNGLIKKRDSLVPKVSADAVLRKLAPEVLRRALLNIAESLGTEEEDNAINHPFYKPQEYSLFRNKEMYFDATEFLFLVPDSSLADTQPQLGFDIFHNYLLDVPTQLELRLNWFQSVLTRSPELDSAKYAVLFSFLVSLSSAQRLLAEQWRSLMTWRGPTYRKRLKIYPHLQQSLLQELDSLLFAVYHARVFVAAVWEYFQVTVIDHQFSKLLGKCFPQKESIPYPDYSKYGDENGSDDEKDPFLDPDAIAGFHQEFISTVYDMVFLDNDDLSKLFLELTVVIKTSSSWLVHNQAMLLLATQTMDITPQEQAQLQKAGNSMRQLSRSIHRAMETIYDQVEYIQQSDDDVATKNPLHLLLLRIEFVRDRVSSGIQNHSSVSQDAETY
ncbi:uncharacterized protein SAPINGB_P005033 [Magnusiomyces paraingens]|uniref:Spindle pole body component n=1 Tax=Magnusiomyces paraingens TaxID=2606893 RepID=A0A5E8BXM1_9ASCO|nr:uncharacterized protein SAPINGB_P005033 [Saprochaete ingens]VVT56389.1 unnamed protein product [Saprochaete ingens]